MSGKLMRLLAVFSISSLSACASIVSGTDSTTYLETKPVDARCRLYGQDFTREVNTPTSVPLPAKASPVTVECNASGYQRSVQQLEASMDGWVFGNLIFGGIIGGVVDIARGAGKKYPPQIQVLLDPATFPSTAERDSYYNERLRIETERWDNAVKTIQGQCDPSNATECTRLIGESNDKRKIEIDRIESNRQSTRIASN